MKENKTFEEEESLRTVGFKILFSTDLSHDDIEDAIDEFLRKVDARKMMAHAAEMTEEEILQEMNK